MGIQLDDRVVEYAWPDRTSIYHRKIRKVSQTPPDRLEPEELMSWIQDNPPVNEYYVETVTTYDLQDINKKHLDYKKIRHEIFKSNREIDIDTFEEKIKATIKSNIRIDKIALSGYDISKT